MSRKRKSISKTIRTSVFNKYGGHCAYCGCELAIDKKEGDFKNLPHLQVDHLVAWRNRKLTEEELNHFDNLMPSCPKCNLYKRAKSLESLRVLLKTLSDRLNKQFTINIAIRYGLMQPVSEWDGVFYFEKFKDE